MSWLCRIDRMRRSRAGFKSSPLARTSGYQARIEQMNGITSEREVQPKRSVREESKCKGQTTLWSFDPAVIRGDICHTSHQRTSVAQGRFFRWIRSQGRSLHASGSSKNASGSVGIPFFGAPHAPRLSRWFYKGKEQPQKWSWREIFELVNNPLSKGATMK